VTEFEILRAFMGLSSVERQSIGRRIGMNADDLAGSDGIRRQFRKIRLIDGGLAKLEAEIRARLAGAQQ
jgi:hypothetical protein